MKRAVIGIMAGAAISLLAYTLYKKNKDGVLGDELHDLTSKAKKNFKNMVARTENQMEYVKDKASYNLKKGKRKLDHMRSN